MKKIIASVGNKPTKEQHAKLVGLQRQYATPFLGQKDKARIEKEIQALVIEMYGLLSKKPKGNFSNNLKFILNSQNMSKPNKKENLTLFEAKKKASELSRDHKDKKAYVLVNIKTGDCIVSFSAPLEDYETHHCYKHGSEISVDSKQYVKEPQASPKTKRGQKSENESLTIKNENKMAQTKKSAPAKKTAKEVPAKKAASAKGTGTKKTIRIKDIVALLKKDVPVFNTLGQPLSLTAMQSRANQDKEREVLVGK